MSQEGGSPGLVVMGGIHVLKSWVCIPAPDNGWTFLHLFDLKNCNVCLKKTENKQESGWGWPIKKVCL